MARGIEHHLHHPLDMPVHRHQAPDVKPQPPGDGGPYLLPVQLFAFDLVGLEHILGQRLEHGLIAERKTQTFHPPDEAPLPMTDAGQWPGYVQRDLLPRLFGFELLMAPYAVAHFKLGLELAARDLDQLWREHWTYEFQPGERLNIYLTNTLDDAGHKMQHLIGPAEAISQEAEAAAAVKAKLPVLVVLGNPPYSGHSANDGEWIKGLVRDYYFVDGKPLGERNPKWLQDDYVKFIRWAQWRIEQTGCGILAYITNHGYLDNPTFRGMRQQLMTAFDEIWLVDLHGNLKKKETTPDGSRDQNVFDIQQGVALSVFVKLPAKSRKKKRAAKVRQLAALCAQLAEHSA